MAVYDPDAKKLVVRVVYDGPGMAGKTTNLQQLCTFFTRQRRSDLYTGNTVADRTLCLDWLQLDGGLVRGHELRCHLLTVPGQAVLSRRRQLLLSLADATVFVVESTESGLHEARPMWLSMLEHTGGIEAGVPVVLQANKQDQPGALGPLEIRERWQLDSRIPIVAAQATNGTGVRETVVLAIRATALALQEQLQGNGITDLEGRYETGEELERRILDAEVANPMSAVDVVLSAHRLEEPVDVGTPIPFSEVVAPAVSAATLQPRTMSDELATASDAGRLAFAGARHATPLHADEDVLAHRRDAAVGAGPAARETPRPASAAGRALVLPTLPAGEMPHGLVWPPAEGRKTLRRVPVAEATLRMDMSHTTELGGQPFARDLVFEAGIWRLRTCQTRCYEHADQARRELVRLAHLQLELGRLRVPRTVLAVQTDSSGRYWVWTVALWLTTLRNQMTYASETEDEAALATALTLYGDLAVQAMRACLDTELVLELEPENFGVLSGEGFYLQDEVKKGHQMPEAAASLLRCFEDYAEHEQALASYQAALAQSLVSGFRPGELAQLGLLQGLESSAVRGARAASARSELLSLLSWPGSSASAS
jgi:signal recognition particle receptor subunit beta